MFFLLVQRALSWNWPAGRPVGEVWAESRAWPLSQRSLGPIGQVSVSLRGEVSGKRARHFLLVASLPPSSFDSCPAGLTPGLRMLGGHRRRNLSRSVDPWSRVSTKGAAPPAHTPSWVPSAQQCAVCSQASCCPSLGSKSRTSSKEEFGALPIMFQPHLPGLLVVDKLESTRLSGQPPSGHTKLTDGGLGMPAPTGLEYPLPCPESVSEALSILGLVSWGRSRGWTWPTPSEWAGELGAGRGSPCN